jgi:aspartate carbamoyltransferase regulatory subunit
MKGGLTPEQIRALLIKPQKTKSASGKTIDTSNRDAMTWFKLQHRLWDEETQERVKCENPNCVDPREGRGALCTKINGQYMCRYCFLDGWLLEIEGQARL